MGLHPTPCMRVLCRVCRLGPNCMLKQSILSLILDSVSGAHESKKGHLWTSHLKLGLEQISYRLGAALNLYLLTISSHKRYFF